MKNNRTCAKKCGSTGTVSRPVPVLCPVLLLTLSSLLLSCSSASSGPPFACLGGCSFLRGPFAAFLLAFIGLFACCACSNNVRMIDGKNGFNSSWHCLLS